MKAVRKIASALNQTPALYLTFDDGPDPISTEPVLRALEHLKIPATFFVVADRAKKNPGLLHELISCGHAIGNHSLDHRYGVFFKSRATMLQWVLDSENLLADLIGKPSVGFRPPAGVRTPKLHSALKELKIPLVLWQKRYFDKAFDWKPARAIASLSSTDAGSIILLHDQLKREKVPLFIETLSAYAEVAKRLGFDFRNLSRELCELQLK